MLIDTVPGSRVKQCDRCGMKWLEYFPSHFTPAEGLNSTRFNIPKICGDCLRLHANYVKLHIRRSLWSDFGVEEVDIYE